MHETTAILMMLFVAFVAAQIGAELAQRMRLPAVVGEIAAGCAVGPFALGWVKINQPLEVLAEIGAVLLLFSVGLETRVGDLKRVGARATFVGVSGVILPFLLGVAWAKWSGFSTPKAMFVASAFVATSAGITARVLQELGVLGRTESRIILAAAVIDDILAMLLLGAVTAIQGGSVNLAGLGFVLAQALGFVLLIAVVGTKVMRSASPLLDAPMNPHSPLALALALCLGLSVAAAHIGLAAIIGAFLAGMAVAETRQRQVLEKQVQPILLFLVPFFFVVTGAQVDVRQLADPKMIGLVALVTLLAVVGKLVGCGLGALSLGKRSALIVGVGMVPRGEVGIIVASLGRQAGVFSASTYAVIIMMSLLTSVIAPPLLKALLAGAEPEEASESEPEEERYLYSVEETGHDRRHP